MLKDDLIDALKPAPSAAMRTTAMKRVKRQRELSGVQVVAPLAPQVEHEIEKIRLAVARAVVSRLLPEFEELIRAFREDAPHEAVQRGNAPEHEEMAAGISAQIDALLKMLDQRRLRQEALALGYLPRDGASNEWKAERTAREALAKLSTDCDMWQRHAELAARRRRGPALGNRRLIAEMAALRLDRERIKLTKGTNGVFTRVVRALYRAAGLSSGGAYRDVCRVLDDHTLRPPFQHQTKDPRSRAKESE